MDLPYALTPSRQNVHTERSAGSKSLDDRFWTHLEHVTVNAVVRASKVDADNRGISTSNNSAAQARLSRSWNLDIDSEDRRHVAAKIYALLVKWTSDFSFEWRAKVANAVRVFEEAMYQQANSEKEYTNPSLLEPQLIKVLHHFEEGNGDYLIEGRLDLDLHQASMSPSSVSHLVAPERLDERENDREGKEMDFLFRDGARDNLLAAVRLPGKELTGSALRDVAARAVDRNRHKLKGYGSMKSRVERVIGIISKRKRRDEKILKLELQKALAEDDIEGLATMLASVKMTCGNEINGVRNAAEELLSNLVETPCTASSGDDIDRPVGSANSSSGDDDRPPPPRRRGTSLRDRLRMERAASRELEDEMLQRSFNNLVSARSQQTPCACGSEDEATVPGMGMPNLHSDPQGHQIPMASSESQIQVQRPSSSLQLSGAGNTFTERNIAESSLPTDQFPAGICRQREEETNDSRGADLEGEISSGGANGRREAFVQQREISPQLIRRVAEEHVSQTGDGGAAAFATDAIPVNPNRVSLMTLLAEGDEESRIISQYETFANSTPRSLASWDTWEDPTEQLDPICCICMVGLKGAALVPCGHTFCRSCSRDLCRGRGSCPLCNRFIREILDIY